MNKSEKEKLAMIISEMVASFESTHEVAMYGRRLLSEFPCVAETLKRYDEYQNIKKVIHAYNLYITKMSCNHSISSKNDLHIIRIGNNGRGYLYNVFDEYFRDDSSIKSNELVETLRGNRENAVKMIKTLLTDEVFIDIIDKSADLTAEQKSLYKGHLLH